MLGDNLSYLLDRYRNQCSKEEAIVFDSAHEELTYAVSDFLYAVQMGTEGREMVLVAFNPKPTRQWKVEFEKWKNEKVRSGGWNPLVIR